MPVEEMNVAVQFVPWQWHCCTKTNRILLYSMQSKGSRGGHTRVHTHTSHGRWRSIGMSDSHSTGVSRPAAHHRRAHTRLRINTRVHTHRHMHWKIRITIINN